MKFALIQDMIGSGGVKSYQVKNNLAYGVSSEDMDLLTFGCPILIRKLSSSKKNRSSSREASYCQITQ